MRRHRLSRTLISALAGGVATGAFVLAAASPASAHFTCADGTPVTSDDPATACEDHGGVAGAPATTAAPAPAEPADEGDTPAPPTTAQPGAKPSATTSTTKKPTTAPAAVTVTPRFTG